MTRKDEITIAQNLIDFEDTNPPRLTPRDVVEWWANGVLKQQISHPSAHFKLSPLGHMLNELNAVKPTDIRDDYIRSLDSPMSVKDFYIKVATAGVQAALTAGQGIVIRTAERYALDEMLWAICELAAQFEIQRDNLIEEQEECRTQKSKQRSKK